MRRACLSLCLLPLLVLAWPACDGSDGDGDADGDPADAFVGDRERVPCSEARPTCHPAYSAGCELGSGVYAEGQFPSARRFLVATTAPSQRIRVAFFFAEMLFGGTELLVAALGPDCEVAEEVLLEDVDVFEEAGEDAILEVELTGAEAGEHLIEVYSDCSADYLLVVEAI